MNSRKLVKITDKSSGVYYHLCLIEFIHGMGSFLCPPNTLPAKKQIVIYKVFCVLFTWKTQWVSNLQVSLAEVVGGTKRPRGVRKLTLARELSYYKLSSLYIAPIWSFSDLVWVTQEVTDERFFTLYTATRAPRSASAHTSWLVSFSYSLPVRLPQRLRGKEPTCQCRRHGFDPWVRKILWRRKWQPTSLFLPGKSCGQGNLTDYSPWGCKRVGHDLVTKQQQRLSFWYSIKTVFLSGTCALLLPGGTPWTTSEGVSRQASWQTRPKHHILCLELFLYFLGDLQGMNDSARRSREKSSGMEESLKNLPWKNIHLFHFVSFSLTFLFLLAFSPSPLCLSSAW